MGLVAAGEPQGVWVGVEVGAAVEPGPVKNVVMDHNVASLQVAGGPHGVTVEGEQAVEQKH